MEIYAYYLPQFHCIPENDKWWGKGFTEWTNVKKANKLYKNHKQPKEPLGDNYYNLENLKTLEWQTELLKSYKVDGLIFYHYYFTGKKLLEKPAELLLNNKNVDLKYFFCWANHSWFRTWEGSKELLIEQRYGNVKEWEKHFEYLLPFFQDERYRKWKNKPMFLIFKSEFKEKRDMFKYFDMKCKENGFDGICIIETIETHSSKEIDKYIENKSDVTEFLHIREPGSTIVSLKRDWFGIVKKIYNKIIKFLNKKYVTRYNGNFFLKKMQRDYYKKDNVIRGLFFEWDNTPRHNERGYVINPPTKSSVFEYLEKIKDDEFIFFNAWNEWCEGMILEPTKENNYKYLEWIKEWKEKNENRIDGI